MTPGAGLACVGVPGIGAMVAVVYWGTGVCNRGGCGVCKGDAVLARVSGKFRPVGGCPFTYGVV
jgi:hypothetical protein